MQSPNSFLEQFSNEHDMPLSDKQQSKVDKQTATDKKKQEKIQEKMFNLQHKEIKPSKKEPSSSSSTAASFSSIEEKTEKLVLQRKIKQYEILFPTELAEFKKSAISKKANKSVDDLQTCIAEMDLLLSAGSVENIDNFILNSILECLRVVEPMSKFYKIGDEKYDISGLSNALKENPQFLSLCKRMLLKYNSYMEVPLPVQLLICVSIQATTIVLDNRIKRQQLNTMGVK